MAKPSFKIEWNAHEYEHKERSQDWFWATGIIVIALAIVSVLLGDVIFAILILVAAFALSLFINREPDTIHIVVDEKGITKDKMRYPYTTLHSFYVDEERSHPTLLLRSHKIWMPLIHVPLGPQVNAERLHETLLQELPQEVYKKHFTEHVLEYFGF